MKNIIFSHITLLDYRIISVCSLSTGKMSVSHSERSDDAGGQYANKTNDEYGEIRASAVKLVKVLLLLFLSIVVMKSTLPITGKGYANVIVNIINVNKIDGLITYFYPLLLLYYTSKKYLKIGDGYSTKTKTKVQNRPNRVSK